MNPDCKCGMARKRETISTLLCMYLFGNSLRPDLWSPISVRSGASKCGHRRCSRSAWLACCHTIGLQPTVSTLCQRGSRTYPPQQLRSSHQRCTPFPSCLSMENYSAVCFFFPARWEDVWMKIRIICIYRALTNLTFITLVCRMCIHTSMPAKILNCTEWIYSRCLFFSPGCFMYSNLLV